MPPRDAEQDWNAAVPLQGNGKGRHWSPANVAYLMPRLKVIDPITLEGKPIPDRKWMVDGWVPQGNVTMLAGDGGVGKSLLAQQLLTCAAIGQDWLGVKAESCRALGIFCEDDEGELQRRQRSLNEHYEIGFGDLENLQWSSRIGQDNALMMWPQFEATGEPTELFQQIHNAAQDFGAQLIVLDSLHDLFAGNENSRVHARQFIQLLASLARDCDGAVLLCAHPSVAGRNTGTGESGSTAWNNAVRSRLYLTRPKADDEEFAPDGRTLRKMKANYSSINDEIQVKWEDSVFIAEQVIGGVVGSIEKRGIEEKFLACLDAVTEQGRSVTDAPNSQRFAPKVFAPLPQAKGITRKQMQTTMNALFASRVIKIGVVIAPNRHEQNAIVRME